MLKEKLGKLSAEHKIQKKTEEQKKEEERLAPIRAEIKDMEEQMHSLEVLRGSLAFKSDKEQGKGIGMEEYASETTDKLKKQETEIENVFYENKEALKEKVGITSKEELIARPEFDEEEEVKAYKSAEKDVKELELTDRQLENRLKKFGIETAEGKLDYAALAEKVGKRIPEFQKELFHKKLETPEGKEEILDFFAKEISEKIPGKRKIQVNTHSFENPRSIQLEGFGVSFNEGYSGYDKDEGVFYDISKKKCINKINYAKDQFVPNVVVSIAKEYGWEIAKEAQSRAIEEKIDVAFDNLSKNVVHLDQYEKDIEGWSPEKGSEAVRFLQEVIQKRDEIGERMDKVQSEKGITLVFNWGSKYANGFVGHLGDEEQSLKAVQKALNEFPPSVDYGKILEACKKQEDFLRFLEEKVASVKTQEDADREFGGLSKREGYKEVFKNKPEYSFRTEDFRRKASYEVTSNEERVFSQERGNIKNYDEAKEYVMQKKKYLREIEADVAKITLQEAEKQFLKAELVEECKDEKLKTPYGKEVQDSSDVRFTIESAEKYEHSCNVIIKNADKFLKEIPEGHLVVLDGNDIIDATMREKWHEVADHQKALESDLKTARNAVSTHSGTKPGLFKKAEWEKKKTDLESEVERIKKNIEADGNKLRELNWKRNGLFESGTYSEPFKEVREAVNFDKVTPGEAETLIEIAAMKVREKHRLPPKVMDLWKKYTTLLTEKKS